MANTEIFLVMYEYRDAWDCHSARPDVAFTSYEAAEAYVREASKDSPHLYRFIYHDGNSIELDPKPWSETL